MGKGTSREGTVCAKGQRTGTGVGKGLVMLAFGLHDEGVWALKGFRQHTSKICISGLSV